MKKFIVCVITACAILGAVACGSSGYAEAGQEDMFVTVYGGAFKGYEIVYNVETKVMYAVSCGTNNVGFFTLLVNPDGTPMIWEG